MKKNYKMWVVSKSNARIEKKYTKKVYQNKFYQCSPKLSEVGPQFFFKKGLTPKDQTKFYFEVKLNMKKRCNHGDSIKLFMEFRC